MSVPASQLFVPKQERWSALKSLLPSSTRYLTIALPPTPTHAQCSHFNVPPIYETLSSIPGQSNYEHMTFVCERSILICFTVYASSGLFGYLTFLGTASSDVFTNFPTSGSTLATIMIILRIGFALALAFAYPLMVRIESTVVADTNNAPSYSLAPSALCRCGRPE